MQAILLTGIQATGKTTFCKERFYSTHMRLNLDMLKTRHREDILLRACLDSKQPFVIDNTNPTKAERQKYIAAAKSAGFKGTGYYFESRVSDALIRNGTRPAPQHISEHVIKGTSARLEIPDRSEGFDELFYVRITPDGFDVQEWLDEV
jgi:predicted kinase